jgi:hypothetical protein
MERGKIMKPIFFKKNPMSNYEMGEKTSPQKNLMSILISL